jgi:hypothetical protein
MIVINGSSTWVFPKKLNLIFYKVKLSKKFFTVETFVSGRLDETEEHKSSLAEPENVTNQTNERYF